MELIIDIYGVASTPTKNFPSNFTVFSHEGLDERFLNPELLSNAPPVVPFISPLHSRVPDAETTKNGVNPTEYSCAVTPQVRQTGNRLSGLAGTAYASLLT